MKLFTTVAILVTALAMTGVHAFELCDVEGKAGELYTSMHSLEKLSKEKGLEEMDAGLNAMLATHEAGKLSDALLHRVFQGFANGGSDLEPRMRQWISEYPRSHAAHLALAYSYTGRGWAARGSKPPPETSPQQSAQAERYFRLALKAYDEADVLAKKPTLSMAQRIFIASGTGSLGLDANKIYREAIAKYPDTLQVRIRYIDASRPRWGGSVKQLESIIGEAKTLPAADRRYIEYLVDQEIGVSYWCAESEGCDDAQTRKGENAKQVVAYFEKSIPLCPGLDRSLERLVRYQTQIRDDAATIRTASRLVERKPYAAWAFTVRGKAYLNTGRYKEAFADYERATQLGDFEAFKDLAWFYESGNSVKNDMSKAIDLYLVADAHGVDGAYQQAERLSKASGIPLR